MTEVVAMYQPAKCKAKIGGKRVLVIDDEASIVDLARETLGKEGYQVKTATDWNSALRRIEANQFDAVISDLNMPGKSGADIFQYCKDKKPIWQDGSFC